ncbi:MAG: radical SAM protein [Bacteroidales bacterium]|nr:radical SAM protein [Bacteroidales bacterium]
MNILLITPPLTQLNTPYPATAYLKGLFVAQGHEVRQVDLGIELADRVLSKEFLLSIGLQREAQLIEPVKRFLRGQDDTLGPRIANRSLLPEVPPTGGNRPPRRGRFEQLDPDHLEWSFGVSGTTDKAQHLATLFIEEIADHIREHIDPHFDLVRYAEYLSNDAPTFDPLYAELQQPPSPIDRLLLELLEKCVSEFNPDKVCITVPFPGCLYGALRCGQWLKAHTHATIELGGGFPNTEWRQLDEPRLYEFCHEVVIDGHPEAIDHCPDFSDLPLDKYLSMSEMTNPMHRLWSQGRWNKMVMAQGCYWHRCAFCDTSLPYIGHYSAPKATTVVDHMERIVEQTGRTGFHFVDEALPPKLLGEVAEEILRRGLTVSFWGNIRFEKAYTAELCDLLAEAGMVAVSGGLEVASDRLLKLMDKGVTIQQTVNACRHLRDAGIMVHTYLMYGFPTETLQETVDALETVRRMFDEGIVQSAFWHRYAMTCHSPSGLNPEKYGAQRIAPEWNPFCNNEVDWLPLSSSPKLGEVAARSADGGVCQPQFPYDIDAVGAALRLATFNYMNGLGLDQPVRSWFPFHVPKPGTKPGGNSR